MRSLRQHLGRMGRLALMLGVLGGVLLLGAVLSPWTWRPSAVEPPPPPSNPSAPTQEAQHALLAGDLPRARQQLEEALAQDPRSAPALLLQACLALEAADTQAVKTVLEHLSRLAPERLEPQLIHRLMESRTRFPPMGWRQAFLQAWTELGHPSFVESSWLPEFDPAAQGFAPADAWKHAPSDAARLTLVLGLPTLTEESALWLMAQVPLLEDAALVQATAAALLPAELQTPLHDEARAVVRRRLIRHVETSPQVMQPRLMLLWAEAPEESAFSPEELERLEAIAALSRWKATSFWQTYLEARRNLKETGLVHPSRVAYQVALWSNTHGAAYLLAKRAEVTRRQLMPGARHRLGRILWNIGSRLSEQSTAMEHLVGLQLMEQGAADLGNEAERERVARLLEAAGALRSASDTAALERWPLPSLWEEVAEARARDEWAHRREFAAPLALPDAPPLESPAHQ
jgi:hypothetical protein